MSFEPPPASASCEVLFVDGMLRTRGPDGRGAADGPYASGDAAAALVTEAYGMVGGSLASVLDGEFSLALHDAVEGVTLAVRDALGARSLFYAEQDGTLFTAPTLRELMARLPRVPALRESRLADFLVDPMEVASETATCFEGIERLPAGHALTWRAGDLRIERYWRPDLACALDPNDDAAFEAGFATLAREAVARRLHAEGAVGSMLSGGVDSTSVSFLAHEVRPSTAWPTVSLLLDDERACVEAPFIRAALDGGAFDATMLRPSQLGPHAEAHRRFLAETLDPFVFNVTGVVQPAFYAAGARGITRLLTGVDGDMLGGACGAEARDMVRAGAMRDLASLARARARIDGVGALRGLWRHAVRPVLAAFEPRWSAEWRRRPERRADWSGAVADAGIEPTLLARTHARDRFEAMHARIWSRAFASSQERHVALLQGPILGNALDRYRRAAHFAGVDLAHPLLDRDLVEFCLALPVRQRMLGGESKSILRRAMRGRVPAAVLGRRDRENPSAAFFLAYTDATFGQLASSLEAGVGRLDGYLRPASIRDALARWPVQRRHEDATRLWKAYTLMSLLERFG